MKQKSLIMMLTSLLLIFSITTLNNITQESNQNSKLTNKQEINNNLYTIENIEIGNNYENNFSGAIINNGQNDVLYMWGDNSYGKLGVGSDETKILSPTPVDINGNGDPYDEGQLKNLSLGSQHTGIVVDGSDEDTLYCWGYNQDGQIGIPTTNGYIFNEPQEIASRDYIEQLSFYEFNSAAIVNQNGSDQLYTWGSNRFGQIGNGTLGGYVDTPKKINVNNNGTKQITNLSNNGYTMSVSVQIDNDFDQLYSWGTNNYGQLGTGNKDATLTPLPIDIDYDGSYGDEGKITQLSGDIYSQAVVVSWYGVVDTLYTVGENNYGQLGIGRKSDYETVYKKANLNLQTNSHITDLDLGFYGSSSVVVDNTSLYTWGLGANGQLGIVPTMTEGIFDFSVSTPTLVDTSTIVSDNNRITDLTTGGRSLMIIVDDGLNQTIYGCGDNQDNILNLKTTTVTSCWRLTTAVLGSYNPEINNESVSIIENNSTSITINYNFKMNGAIPTSVDLYLDDVLQTTDSTPTVIDDYLTGSFIINDLMPSIEYKVSLVIKITRPEINLIESFQVDTILTSDGVVVNYPSLTISQSTTIPSTETTATFATSINYGNDSANKLWTISNYLIYDENNQLIESKDIVINNDESFTIINLEPGTTYQNWTVKTTWSSPNEVNNYKTTTIIPDFSTSVINELNNNYYLFLIYGVVITILIIFLVFIFIRF